MTTQEKQMIEWGCPVCGSEIELYDTHPTGDKGRYRCPTCKRDTTWATGKAMSFPQIIEEMKKKIDSNKIL